MAFSKIATGGIDGSLGDEARPNAKPLWINGNMQVNQRGDTTGKGEGHSGYYACDRYKFNEDGTQDVVLSISQETLTSGNAYTTDGHTRALKYDVTTADTSLASNIYTRITQRFEKSHTTLIKKGTSSAEKLTLAFWVKATKTGTQIVEILDQVNTRHCCASYTISSADTWEHKVLNFPADTTGALGTGNGLGLEVNFVLAAGSNYTSGTLATSWASQTAANIAVGQVNNFDSTSNNFHLTGIQLEIGEYTSSTLPPFQHESYGDNLLRCQRYLAMIGNNAPITGSCNGAAQFNSASLWLPCSMRATPTVSNFTQIHCWFDDGTAFGDTSISIANIKHIADTNSVYFNINSLSGMTDNKMASGYLGTGDDATKVQWDAEL
jgi:hypothetical protein